jgi:hypothetical protein
VSAVRLLMSRDMGAFRSAGMRNLGIWTTKLDITVRYRISSGYVLASTAPKRRNETVYYGNRTVKVKHEISHNRTTTE